MNLNRIYSSLTTISLTSKFVNLSGPKFNSPLSRLLISKKNDIKIQMCVSLKHLFVFPWNTSWCFLETLNSIQFEPSVWSRGMIPPLGGGGPGFKSPNGPFFCIFGKVLRERSILAKSERKRRWGSLVRGHRVHGKRLWISRCEIPWTTINNTKSRLTQQSSAAVFLLFAEWE